MIANNDKFIVDGDICSHVENINGYLVGAQNICIGSSSDGHMCRKRIRKTAPGKIPGAVFK